MNALYFLLMFPGFYVGLLVWTRIGHLALAIVGIKHGMHPPPATPPETLKKQLVLLCLFIGSWLLGFAVLAYYFHTQVGSPGWPWFFGGVGLAPCVVVPAVLALWRRASLDAARDA